MHSLSARRALSACAISAASFAALLAPGVASAKTPPSACVNGANITAQGSSLQAPHQKEFWTKEFDGFSTKDFGCGGAVTAPTVTYESSGSGTALKSWGAEAPAEGEPFVGFGPNNAFLGVDEPPNETQLSNLDGQESVKAEGAESVESIPVAQAAVAIIVHLPTGCTASSTVANAENRLVLSDAELAAIYQGEIKKWGELNVGGDKVTCPEEPITIVVREDGSGTTHITKRFLGQLDPSTSFEYETGKFATWGELSEASLNKKWPLVDAVVKPVAKGGGELANKVNEIPGAIGYLNLFEARAKGFEGKEANKFWVEIQNTEKVKTVKGVKVFTYTFQDPSTDYDTATTASSNCEKEDYVVAGSLEPFPPATTLLPWDKVTTNPSEKKSYALCGLTYDIAFSNYYSVPGTSKAEEETVKQYLQFLTAKKGGQLSLAGHDYLALPTAVLTRAAKGAKEINYTE
jgi:ABC-type phosphate transport system substrate-binding protein